jgi:ABC-type nitrate/sulfonate/bicarbonate transport system permease component
MGTVIDRTSADAGATPASADAVPVAPTRRRSKAVRRARAVSLLQKAVALLIALVIWHVFARTGGSAAGVPTPVELVETGSDMVVTGDYWSAVGNTLASALIGFALSVLIGVPIGLLNGSFPAMERSTRFVIDFGRTIPGVAILPVVLLLFGSNRSMVLILVMFSAVWPMLVQATYAAQQLSPQMRQVATSFRLSRTSRIRDIYFPSALPFLMTGLRISATISLLITISSEFLGGAPGLGQRLYSTLTVNDNDRMFVYVVTAALLGVVLNWLLVAAQRRVLWWHPSEREKNR